MPETTDQKRARRALWPVVFFSPEHPSWPNKPIFDPALLRDMDGEVVLPPELPRELTAEWIAFVNEDVATFACWDAYTRFEMTWKLSSVAYAAMESVRRERDSTN